MAGSINHLQEPGNGRRARFVTFGCKVNQYDTQVLRERATGSGYTEVEEDADLIVVNTCTVTEHGGALARKAVRRLARENPRAKIYVTGCYAVSDPETSAALPNVVAVVSNDDKTMLLDLLGKPSDRPFIEETVCELADHTRAFLKVQDGCHLRCAYCIIPFVRPAVTSKRADTVVGEIRRMVSAGRREVVLTGVHLGAFGRDFEDDDPRNALTQLVTRILSETDIERVRLSSIEANEVTPELVRLYAAEDRLAPHFHVPLQAGSAAVLARMRRRYNPAGFLKAVSMIREAIPDAAITTDVIVGFPGEAENDFAETLRMMREAAFMKTHVFPFSRREGTPAATMVHQAHSRDIRRRVARANELSVSLARDYARSRVGTRAGALIESRRIEGRLTGFTGRYLRVVLEGEDHYINRVVPVRITGLSGKGVTAEVEAS